MKSAQKKKPLYFHIVSLFPETVLQYCNESIIARAIQERRIQVKGYNPRDYAPKDLRKKWPDGNVTTYIDGRPFGGGPGMVLRAEPIIACVEKIKTAALKRVGVTKKKIATILFAF